MESSLRIVAITNCPAGIAHTYMVAEALEQKARSLGHTIKGRDPTVPAGIMPVNGC